MAKAKEKTLSPSEKAKVMSKVKSVSKGAWEKARKSDVTIKGATLPGGIVGGVMQLSSWKMGLDKKSNPYFSITGVVLEPAEHDGKKATITHYLSKTKNKTVQEVFERFVSDIKILSGEEKEDEVSQADPDDIPSILDGLVEEKVVVEFNTWKPEPTKQFPNPRLYIQLQKRIDDYEASEDDEESPFEEETEDELTSLSRSELKALIKERELSITVTKNMSDDDIREAIKALSEEDEEEVEEAEEEEEEEEETEEEADEEETEEEETEETEEEEEEEEEEEKPKPTKSKKVSKTPKKQVVKETAEEEYIPVKGDIFKYKTSPKKQPEEVKVLSTNKAKRSVDVQTIKGKQVYKGVPFTSLIGEEG